MGPSRLRKKFVKTFVLTGLVPLVLMGGVSIYLVNLTHRIDVEALERNLSRQVATEVKKIADEAVSIIELVVAFDEYAPIAFNQQDFFLESILKENESLAELSFICVTPSFCEVGSETKRWLRTEGGLTPSLELRNLSRQPAFLTSQEGKNYLGEVEFRNDGLRIPIAAPVYNGRHQLISVLAAEMDLSLIQEIVKGARLGEAGYVYLVNREGKIIAHQEEKFLGEDATALPAVLPLISQRAEEAERSSYTSLSGENVSGAGSFIPDLGWGVIAEWPRAETQEIIRTIFIQIGFFSLVALLLIAGISSWVALRLIEPIAELNEGTNIIGSGNFGYRVSIKTGDELESLGTNLNKMAENLKDLEKLRELKLRTELLSESLRKEQELSKLKDQFITTVSHQFNTPLSVINWAVEALNKPKIKTAEIKENLDVIAKSGKDIAAIVADLTTLSEIGFRYQKSNTKPTDIAALTQKVIEAMAPALKIKNIKVDFNQSTPAVTANVNEFTMRKVLENLIDNAIAYSNEGGEVTVELAGSKEQSLMIKVADQGIGIPKEDQPSIFQQFFRARNATAKKNVGTGLGLFIAKNIVEGHGGKIWFQSEENKGSTFYISLPR